MSRLGLMGSIVLACGILIATASGGSAAASAGGTLPLNTSGVVNAISCGAVGDCAAGGFYYSGNPLQGFPDPPPPTQAFVVSETSSTWGTTIEVPGTAALNSGGYAETTSVSCAAAGECVAGGYYTDKNSDQEAFVATETSGAWNSAIEVPGTDALNVGGLASVDSISCAAAGECAVGGFYRAEIGGSKQAFVVSETNGNWGTAVEVPGMEKLKGGSKGAGVNSISCVAPGDCSAGGQYGSPNNPPKAFVASETNGTWANAIEVPGTDTANIDWATVNSVSCGAIGDCAAGGSYDVGFAGSSAFEPFTVTEKDGVWGTAVEVPGIRTLNTYGDARLNSISCTAAGDCSAGGDYNSCCSPAAYGAQAFVVNETNGTWGNAIEVPGTAMPSSDPFGQVDSISCAAPGDCAAGGYANSSLYYPNGAFVADASNGRWGTALDVPGAVVQSISCAAPGDCGAAGISFRGPYEESFLVDETNGSWGKPAQVFPAACVVPSLVGWQFAAAKRKLVASDCGLGKITTAYSKAKKGHITAQQPKAGQILKAGARVALTVSKGERT